MINHANIENLNVTETSGHTALHSAANSGNKDIIFKLLESGSNPNAKLKLSNETPYDLYKSSFGDSGDKEIENAFIKYMELRPFPPEQDKKLKSQQETKILDKKMEMNLSSANARDRTLFFSPITEEAKKIAEECLK